MTVFMSGPRVRRMEEPACLPLQKRGPPRRALWHASEAPSRPKRGTLPLPPQEHVHGSLATVGLACGHECGDVLARWALRQPGAHLPAQDTHAMHGVIALAVNDEQAALAARAHRPQKELELGPRLFDAHSVEVEARVDRQHPPAQSAQRLERQIDSPTFDSPAVISQLEPRSAFDQLA